MVKVADLVEGNQFRYRDVLVTVLRSPEEGHEPWGSPNLRVWARREDTSEEGFVTYGMAAEVELL